jgi:hypothetical protein
MKAHPIHPDHVMGDIAEWCVRRLSERRARRVHGGHKNERSKCAHPSRGGNAHQSVFEEMAAIKIHIVRRFGRSHLEVSSAQKIEFSRVT